MPPGADHAPDLLSLVLELKPLKPAHAPPRSGAARPLLARPVNATPTALLRCMTVRARFYLLQPARCACETRSLTLQPVHTLRHTALEPAPLRCCRSSSARQPDNV